jgi:hypothetical protein
VLFRGGAGYITLNGSACRYTGRAKVIANAVRLEEMSDPLVSVCWLEGQAELKRGSNGEAVWGREPSGWGATVMDLGEVERASRALVAPGVGVQLPTSNLSLHGYKFYVYGRRDNRSMEGCTLDAGEGGVIVVKEAI